MELMAAAAFGLEGLVKQELQDLGFMAKAEQGGARFETDYEGAFTANLWLACADRVLIIIGEQKVTSFEELFNFVTSLPWEHYLPRDARFPVSGNCVRSQLMSVSDCQSITKKAIVERLSRKYKVKWFEESGSTYPITIAIHKDLARVTLDTSGNALNKRGYRTWVGEAPIRETLAAAMVRLSPWQADQPFYDPCCGTGTLLIEAAYLAMNRAPGLTREFAMESWATVDSRALQQIRKEAKARCMKDAPINIVGSDIDPEAIKLCEKHINQAGLQGKITVRTKDFRDVCLQDGNICFVTNPPYGERLGDQKKAALVAKSLGVLLDRHPGSSLSVITPDARFEAQVKRQAKTRRRLYNGRLECEFLTFPTLNQ